MVQCATHHYKQSNLNFSLIKQAIYLTENNA